MTCVALGLALVFGSPALPARADGDPASDVLATQTLFLPQDAAASATQQTLLEALLREASRSGAQLRVAVIASPADLGSIAELWGQPVNYARFLGQELSLTYPGTLLVLMPGGFGLYDQGQSVRDQQAALAGVVIPHRGGGLGSAAVQAILHLAAVQGHPLRVPRAATPGASGSGAGLPWLAFVLGLLLIGAAWAASLKARPLRLG